METLHHKALHNDEKHENFRCPRRRFLKALMVLAALPVMPAWAQVGLDVGRKAPDFSAAGLDGKTQRLSTVTAASRATVVYFWATWCSPCISEFADLETLYRKLKDQGVTLLSINFKETASTAKTFTEDAGASFPVLLDTDGKIAAQFLVWPLPAIFVLDAKGIVRHKIIGATNMAALEAKIVAVTGGG
jgi:peroxiredoxin